MIADEDIHRHATENLDQANALLFGRVIYQMMEAGWRRPAPAGARPDWMEPFARTIDAAKKYVVSSTLDRVDWNAELVRVDLGKAVQQLKRESGKGLLVGGVTLPLALAEMGLIDEYKFVVQPRLAGHGPTLFAGLSKRIDLKLVSPAIVQAAAEMTRLWDGTITVNWPRLLLVEYASFGMSVRFDGTSQKWPVLVGRRRGGRGRADELEPEADADRVRAGSRACSWTAAEAAGTVLGGCDGW